VLPIKGFNFLCCLLAPGSLYRFNAGTSAAAIWKGAAGRAEAGAGAGAGAGAAAAAGSEGRRATTLMDTQLRNAESAFACSRCQSVPQFVSHHSLPSIHPSIHLAILRMCVYNGWYVVGFYHLLVSKNTWPTCRLSFHFTWFGSVWFGFSFGLLFSVCWFAVCPIHSTPSTSTLSHLNRA